MRLYFHRFARRARSVFNPARTVARLSEELRYTSLNSGNLVHLEAMPKMLKYDDRHDGGVGDLGNIEEPRIRKAIDANYDGIVIQYANMIRGFASLTEETKGRSLPIFSMTADWLRETSCKIFVFGIGIQDELEPRPDAVPPELFSLLKVLNDRATIFSVRGKKTEAWLHSVGLTNAVALGCPSLFVYPANTARITAPAVTAQSRVATAGHLQRNAEEKRLQAIIRIGQTFPSSYVFQNDFYALCRKKPDAPIYNEATGEVDGAVVREIAGEFVKTNLGFDSYYLFRSVDKWRGFTTSRDIYFGDRFHGGVIFLQCGRPAVLVSNDARVSELADFFSIPVVQSGELLEGDPVALLKSKVTEESLARFRSTYVERLKAFRDAVYAAGLELANEDACAEVLGVEPIVGTADQHEDVQSTGNLRSRIVGARAVARARRAAKTDKKDGDVDMVDQEKADKVAGEAVGVGPGADRRAKRAERLRIREERLAARAAKAAGRRAGGAEQGARALMAVAGHARDRRRSEIETSIDAHEIQFSNATKTDRYPHVFRVVAELCEGAELAKPRILSYGCSTGEEVDSLANMYFKESEILGVDVAESVVTTAREKFGANPRVRFELSEREALLKEQPFSVIFAMSVLCRWPETRHMTDIGALFSFDVYQHHVTLLDQLLAPGGVMVIYNANYSFLHTKTSQNYDLILHPRIQTNGFVRQFRPDGSFAEGREPTDCIYRKHSGDDTADKTRLTIYDTGMRAIGCIDRGIPAD